MIKIRLIDFWDGCVESVVLGGVILVRIGCVEYWIDVKVLYCLVSVLLFDEVLVCG